MKQPLTLTIAQDPYGWDLFETNTITVTDNVTIFAGPNGYGKSSLLSMMKEALKQQDYMTHTWHFIKNMSHEIMEVLHIHIKRKNSLLKEF